MKNKLYFSLLLLICLLTTSYPNTAAAQNSDKKNVLKVNILSPIFRTLSTFYEHAINPKNSVQIGVLYTGFSIINTQFRGFALTPEYRFYFSDSKEAPQGFYLAPFLRYQNFKLTLTDNTNKPSANFSSFGGGLVAGHQWLFSDIVTLDLFLGPAYNSNSIKVNDNSVTEDDFNIGSFSGFRLRTGITVGVAF